MVRTLGRKLLYLGVAAAVSLATAVSALGASASPSATAITVNMTEFKFALSPKAAKKGVVVFTVVNKGKVGHDFKISGKKTPVLAKGKRSTLRVTFKASGRYKFLCTVPGHAPAGMKGTLVVT